MKHHRRQSFKKKQVGWVNAPNRLLNRVMFFIAGMLVSVLVIAVFLKLFTNFFWALFIGSIVNFVAGWKVRAYAKNSDKHQLAALAWGTLISTFLIIVAAVVIWLGINVASEGILGS